MIDLNLLYRMQLNNLSTSKLHEKTFTKFKNIYNHQKDIVILATGPTAAKYKFIDDAIHIGVNRAFQMNNIKNLDYVFIQDFSGKTPIYIDALDNYAKDTCIKFYGLTTEWSDNPNRVIPESHAIAANALRYRTDWFNFGGFKCKFAYDLTTEPLGCFGSVVFPALQFALWAYPRKIYLVGCDCSTSGYAYNSQEKNYLLPDIMLNAYKQFKIFKNKYYPNVEIISINPVGLRGLFTDIFY